MTLIFILFSQQLQIHEQDGSVVVSLREANAKLSAQLSALQESLNDTPPSVPHSTSSSSSPSAKDCNQHCLLLVEAAQERLFKKIVSKFGQDALNVLESADFGIPRRPGRVMTGPPPVGKVPDDILVVGRDGKVLSGKMVFLDTALAPTFLHSCLLSLYHYFQLFIGYFTLSLIQDTPLTPTFFSRSYPQASLF